MVGPHPQQGDHPGRPDPRPDRLAHGLGRGRQRHHQEGGVAVEGDQLARREPAGEDGPRAQPGEQDGEDPGQPDVRGVQRGLRPGHPDPGAADLRTALGVPGDELALSAEAPQHPQPGDGVAAQRGQPALDLPLDGLPGLQRPDHHGEQAGQHGHADQDHQPEGGVGPQHEHAHHGERGDRPGEPRGHVVDLADPRRVVGQRRDHLAGGGGRADRGTDARRPDGRATGRCAGRPASSWPPRTGDASRRRPTGPGRARSGRGSRPRRRRRPGRPHPRRWCGPARTGITACEPIQTDPEQRADGERAPLQPGQAQQEAHRRAQVRRHRRGVGKGDHNRPP